MIRQIVALVAVMLLAVAPVAVAQDFCKGNFDYDDNVDGTDASIFKEHFGRSSYENPCPPDGPAPVPKTWQTFSYYPTDDGYYQKGLVWPSPRWTDNEDGTITDNLTGLIWMKDANCALSPLTWESALEACYLLISGYCGLTDGSVGGDWRLPNIKEFLSIIDYESIDPAIWSNPFYNGQSTYYWTSTTHAYDTSFAWTMDMFDGFAAVDYKTNSSLMWCVRGGQ